MPQDVAERKLLRESFPIFVPCSVEMWDEQTIREGFHRMDAWSGVDTLILIYWRDRRVYDYTIIAY